MSETADSPLSALRLYRQGRGVGDPGPFPMRLLEVPGLLGDLCDDINSTAIRRQPVLALAASIAALGAVYGRDFASETGLRSNLLILGIGPTGSGKDHARKRIKNAFAKAGLARLLGGEELASDTGLLSALQRHPVQLFLFDEYGQLLKVLAGAGRGGGQSHLARIPSLIMRLHTSADSLFLGKEYGNRDGSSPRVDINQPCQVIYGTTIAENFFSSLQSESVLDGFLNRHLVFVAGDVLPPKRWVPHTDPSVELVQKLRKAFDRRRADVSSDAPPDHVTPVTLTTDAAMLFRAFDEEADERVRQADDFRRHLWVRAAEHAAKLAMVRALGCGQTEIGGRDAVWAIDLTGYLVQKLVADAALRIADTPIEADTKKCYGIISAGGPVGMQRTAFTKKTQWLDKRRRNSIVETLEESGQVLVIKERPARNGVCPGRLVAKEHQILPSQDPSSPIQGGCSWELGDVERGGDEEKNTSV